ncbi:GSCFA domain-containing protein, partial [Maritalea sp.]|uniref:GSCFA domain-containing protein n=1 Tax=Maritalea sp. TaxID=2003361 RepID=UPI003EFA55C3
SLGYLEKAIKLALKHGRKDLQILLTVSPVPMMATHRRTDVMSANCYSKSTLRSAAEHVASAFGSVSYYPSYESVTLSDRRIAWADDMIHVTPYIVELNVSRMINAFSGGTVEGEPELPQTDEISCESSEALILAERARSARRAMDSKFFEENRSAAQSSEAFALEYAHFLNDSEQYKAALAAIQSDDRYQASLLRAEIFLSIKDYDAAIQTAERLCEMNRKGQKQWMLLLRALTAIGDSSKILSFEGKWLAARPREKANILTQTGSALRSIGSLELAIERLETAVSMAGATVYTTLVCAAAMIEAGRPEDARPLLNNLQGETQWQIEFAARLRERLPARPSD